MSNVSTIWERLHALPPKISTAFRQLVTAGVLDEDQLASIIDAGELAGERHKLLGFGIAFVGLLARGVPVDDVIRMAKSQRRRINLSWHAKRWQLEHDLLSRAEALGRLAQENVQYDVSQFEALLPETFSGYLIRTSRRLGMEGLRQRHCVAGYHSQLQAGTCAIASVFVDRRRWTVQLTVTGQSDRQLGIVQIKTRYNDLPSKEIRDEIFIMLGVKPLRQAGPSTVDDAERFTYMDTLRRLLPVLRQHNIAQVRVSFDGSCDSGSIDNIDYDGVDFNANNVNVETIQVRASHEDGQWIHRRVEAPVSVDTAIHDLTYDYLQETNVDWYNDEGGFGELVIDVDRETVALEINVRYSETNTEFCTERDIATGEIIE